MKSPNMRLVLLPVAAIYAAAALALKSKRKLPFALCVAGAALFAFSYTYDVNDNTVFELDANTSHQSVDDWVDVYNGTSHALATTSPAIVGDVTNSGTDNIFAGGGSKDTLGIQSGQWQWTTGKPQGKDDIEHAYAAAYNIPNGCGPGDGQTPCHIAVFFGVDRWDNSGDSTMGFWFFQDSNIGLTTTKKGGGFQFSGVHKDGDLLIIANFTIGGSLSTPVIYKWQGDDATGSLVGPASVPSNEAVAVVNGAAGEAPAWGFTNKSGQNYFDHGEFLEGGVDLNAIFGSNLPCFTKFMAETRSSQSPTATLSDFSMPEPFPLCGISVAKACLGTGTISADGTSVTYNWTATVTNTGAATLYNVKLLDALLSGTTPIPVVSSLAPHTSTSVALGPFVAMKPDVADPLNVTNSVTSYGFSAPSGGVEIDSPLPAATATCTTAINNKISITKACDTSNGGATLVADSISGKVVVKVFVSGTVKNSGNAELTNITYADSPSSFTFTAAPTSLAPGDSKAWSGYYYPSGIDVSGVAGRFLFNDKVAVTGATAALGTNPTPVNGCINATDLSCATASCPICPYGACPTSP